MQTITPVFEMGWYTSLLKEELTRNDVTMSRRDIYKFTAALFKTAKIEE